MGEYEFFYREEIRGDLFFQVESGQEALNTFYFGEPVIEGLVEEV